MEESNKWKDWNSVVWWTQLMVAFGWAGLIVFLWLSWTYGAMGNIAPGNDGAVGVTVMLTSGCCGMTWIVGLVPIALVFTILRR